jgi:hypothetical protein
MRAPRMIGNYSSKQHMREKWHQPFAAWETRDTRGRTQQHALCTQARSFGSKKFGQVLVRRKPLAMDQWSAAPQNCMHSVPPWHQQSSPLSSLYHPVHRHNQPA